MDDIKALNRTLAESRASLEIKLAAPSEVSSDFVQGMADRMAISFFKYGPVKNNYPFPGNAIESLRRRLSKYAEDGNTEWLMDAANFAMIEFMFPGHSEAHFRATDSNESPGVKVDGEGFVRDNLSAHKAGSDHGRTRGRCLGRCQGRCLGRCQGRCRGRCRGRCHGRCLGRAPTYSRRAPEVGPEIVRRNDRGDRVTVHKAGENA